MATEAPPLSSTQQIEASTLLLDAVGQLSGGGADLKLILRKCIHTCNLLGWDTRFFEAEINGYHSGEDLPQYRKNVPGYVEWRPYDFHAIASKVVEEGFRGSAGKERVTRDAWWGIDDLRSYANIGLAIPTGEEETRYLRLEGGNVQGQHVVRIDKAALQRVVAGVENEIFLWASRTYTILKFGDAVSDIWQSVRSKVDQMLAELGLDEAARQIQSGLLANTAEGCRQAMLGCRNVLHDVAQHLWRDPRPTYDRLPGDAGHSTFTQVTDDKYVNRLIAYQHQKGVFGTAPGDYMKADWMRLRKLNDLASSGKDITAVSPENAQLTVISIYLAIGELIRGTDMLPITEYQ